MDGLLIAYVFLSFTVGIACLGVIALLARENADVQARRFLWFFLSLSVLVISGLVLVVAASVPNAVSPRGVLVAEYLESFVARYSVMLTLPLFAHSVFAFSSPLRERLLAGIVTVAFAAQHLTEFVLPPVWDLRGDVAEDVLFAALIVYTICIGIRGVSRSEAHGPLAMTFLALLLAGLPLAVHDLFLAEESVLRLHPLWYCISSVVMTVALYRRRYSFDDSGLRENWGMSDREVEVVMLVQRGMSNREIAEALHISINTVKTHLRAIFTKSGFRSRLSLVTGLPASRGPFEPPSHPSG